MENVILQYWNQSENGKEKVFQLVKFNGSSVEVLVQVMNVFSITESNDSVLLWSKDNHIIASFSKSFERKFLDVYGGKNGKV